MVVGDMVSGRRTLSEMEAALAELRKQEARLNERSAGLADEMGRQRADEAEILRDLARFKLADGGAAIANRLDRVSRDALTAIEGRDRAIAALATERKTMAQAVAELEAKLAEARRELDAVDDRMEALGEPFAAALAADEAHQALVATAEKADAIATAAETKAAQAEADRAEKRAAYEADPLFLYLWRRGYGTADYQSRGLIRVLDRWVAGLIGYASARANFAMLTAIPVRLRAHADRLAQEADAADAAVAESEDAILARLAGEDLAGEAEKLGARIAGLETELAPLRQELERLDQQLSAYAAGEDEEFRRTISALSSSLAGEDIAALRAEALATPSPEDERFVARLGRIRADVANLEHESAAVHEQLSTVSRRRAELAEIVADIRSRGWDEGGTTFDTGEIISALLRAFLFGRLSRGDYWGRIEKSYRRGPSGSRGGGWPGGFRTGSRTGGGGFRTGGRIGGGGFRTGRKF